MLTRILIAAAWLLIAAISGGGIWMIGMLLMAFSGDNAKLQSLPTWLEPTMIVGWPISLVVAVVIPPILYACGLKGSYSAITAGVLLLISAVFYATCWITLIMPR
jgi:hypothetical protein